MHHPKHEHHNNAEPDQRPYWKRAHRDWRFWLALVLMFAAMAIYVGTNDLSMRPSRFYTQAPR